MTDRDIIDTIAGAMRRRVRYPTDEAAQHNANAVLAALRERYAIVPRPEPPIGGYEQVVESGKKRYATVELPPPDDGPDGAGEYTWNTAVAPVSTCNRQVWMEDCDMDPDWAEELAAALLAAADKAEGVA